MLGSQIHALPEYKHLSKKSQNRKHSIYIQYPLTHSPYSNYTAINSSLKIGDQIRQGMTSSTAGQQKMW